LHYRLAGCYYAGPAVDLFQVLVIFCEVIDLDITWLGHSCFRIKGKESIVITDPCNPDTGYPLGKLRADIVTVSHSHSDHSYLEAIEGEYRVIKGPGEYELKGVFITGIPTFHDNNQGGERGKNNVYLLEIDGVTLCHLGDIGHLLSSGVEEELGDVGVLFLPVGGVTTIDSSIAADIVRRLAPKIVIPMHYKTPVVTRELEPLDNFLKKMGLKEITSQPKFSVNRSTLPPSTQVVILNYPHQ
jgi:L-ascorbate metabolism protein UlaG (beta-lactamase superfamily)